jgi:cytochrome c-type biogenesis protein CcmH/NrfG
MEKAIAAYRQALELNPRDAEGWLHLAECLAHLGLSSDARNALDKVLALHPGHHQAAALIARLNKTSDTP